MLSTKEDITPAIVLLADELSLWTGGIDLLMLFINGLDCQIQNQAWPVLLPDGDWLHREYERLRLTMQRLKNRRPTPPTRFAQLKDAAKESGNRVKVIHCAPTPSDLIESMRKAERDLIFPCLHSLGRVFPYAWVGYIADLQHKRLPHFFSTDEIQERDKRYSELLRDSSVVVANAKAVVDDIRELYPQANSELVALPFCPPVRPTIPRFAQAKILEQYSLPSRYFIVCNQFWIHKSHQTVFKALKCIREAGYGDVHIVCTGKTDDFRWPDYFQRLCEELERDGLTEYVRFTGLIPKMDQLAILQNAIAVIQPTLFEGGPGGGAVYDAIATATPAIVSDIPVNREVDIGMIDFFHSGSHEDLAKTMTRYLETPPERLTMEDTLAMLLERRRLMGRALLHVFSIAYDRHRNFGMAER